MSRITRVVMVAAAFALGSATTARADGYLEVLNRCGGVAFQTCGSVTIRVTGTQVKIRIQNLSGVLGGHRGGVFTSIAILNVPAGVSSSVSSTTTGPSYLSVTAPTTWRTAMAPSTELRVKAPTGDNAADGGIASACATVPSNMITGTKTNLWMTPGCGATAVRNPTTNSGWVEITFNTNASWDPTNVSVAMTHVNLENMTQVETWEMCPGGDCSAGITPEPASIILLGTGLAGIALRARRRKNLTDRL